MNGFKDFFDSAENIYMKKGSQFENFRSLSNRDIYGFCINLGGIDNQALSMAKEINNELYIKFINQPKGLTGYKDNQNEYLKLDDTDSKHIFILTYLFNNNKVLYNKIVEIGGGFGNMCRLCNNIISYNSWDIIDLPHMSELQKYYLENEIKDISKINFINTTQKIEYENTIDLVIGTHSVSEFSWDIFINYYVNVISKSKYFYMGYNKYCPSPDLINMKIDYILKNGFILERNFDYTEIPHGANVSYSLFKNTNN
jgi:hypothetical protein